MAKKDKNKNKYAIEVNDLDKSFWIPDDKVTSLKSYFTSPWRIIQKKGQKFNALSDINFKVEKGEFIGIIGKNGSGKSTLLKLIAGIYVPDRGRIKVNGKIVPFLELGVGFNPDLSARENIFLNGTILGMTRKYLKSKLDEILDFAEIREFADTPIKNFSSGMVVRLAFSIAIQTNADIYLLDEVFAVGDPGFRAKSLKKLQNLKERGATMILVSHGMEQLVEHVTRIIYLKEGRIESEGNPQEMVDAFLENLEV